MHTHVTRRAATLVHAPMPCELPSVRAIPFSDTDANGPVRLLSNRQRHQIASIAIRTRLRRNTIVYREHTRGESIFIVADGIIKTFRNLPNGKRPVLAFWFPEDIFGLMEAGLYVNTTQAVTDVTLFRIPLEVLKETLLADASLQLQLLCKVTHELRGAQRHTIAVQRRDAVGRLAMFLRALEDHEVRHDDKNHIHIPMSRTDIADYVGLTPEAISRACRRLAQHGIVKFADRSRAQVLDRRLFERLGSA
jgi:CRP/FNR family transcriptional regulator